VSPARTRRRRINRHGDWFGQLEDALASFRTFQPGGNSPTFALAKSSMTMQSSAATGGAEAATSRSERRTTLRIGRLLG
jgi:hypothetical protein